MKITQTKMPEPSSEAPGMVFPCTIDVKIFVNNEQAVEAQLKEFVVAHLENKNLHDWRSRSSSAGKYLAITASVKAQSRDHIDRLYQALHDHDLVIMML